MAVHKAKPKMARGTEAHRIVKQSRSRPSFDPRSHATKEGVTEPVDVGPSGPTSGRTLGRARFRSRRGR